MKKIFLIIQREYLTRVRKRSFLVMTILGPLLMAATIVLFIYLSDHSEEIKKVAVLDESGIFYEKFKDSDNIRFRYIESDIQSAKSNFGKSGDDALLYIPKPDVSLPSNAILYSENSVNISIISYVRTIMGKQIEELKLQASLKEYQTDKNQPIPVDDIMRSIRTSVDINTMKIEKDGKESKSFTELNMVLGMVAGMLIYFFIFMFGSQVMRGVIEEKTSRIVEVIVSSVKPFQLMMGKIVGVGLVGLTQFLLWVVLTFGIVTVVTTTMVPKNGKKSDMEKILQQQKTMNPDGVAAFQQQVENSPGDENSVMEAINSIDFFFMIRYFVFYFIFGYLFYAAFFAAIGSAVDSEADTQQFILPITLPLIFAIVMAQYVIREPNGPWAFWLSIIPFTSPVIMMIRLAFHMGNEFWQLYVSMVLLLLGFLANTWIASKIYRTGILMYGKKVSYKELWRWIRYK